MASKSREWTAAPDLPPVLSAEVVGDRVLATVEVGEISAIVEAPVGTTEDELEAILADVPESIVRTTERFAETTMTETTATDHVDRSTEIAELSAEELRELYVELDDLVGHGAGLSENEGEFEELRGRYIAAWKGLERRAEDYPECPECGVSHWQFEHGGGPAFCAECGHTPSEDLQIAVHESSTALVEGGA